MIMDHGGAVVVLDFVATSTASCLANVVTHPFETVIFCCFSHFLLSFFPFQGKSPASTWTARECFYCHGSDRQVGRHFCSVPRVFIELGSGSGLWRRSSNCVLDAQGGFVEGRRLIADQANGAWFCSGCDCGWFRCTNRHGSDTTASIQGVESIKHVVGFGVCIWRGWSFRSVCGLQRGVCKTSAANGLSACIL